MWSRGATFEGGYSGRCALMCLAVVAAGTEVKSCELLRGRCRAAPEVCVGTIGLRVGTKRCGVGVRVGGAWVCGR